MENCFQAFETPGTTYREMKRELLRLKKEMPFMYLNPSSKIVRLWKFRLNEIDKWVVSGKSSNEIKKMKPSRR